MRALLLLIALVGCGPKKPEPVRTLPDHAQTDVSGTPTGATAHLSCTGTNADRCQAPPFTFHAVYDKPDVCRVNMNNNNEFMFQMGSNADPGATITVAIASFRGAGVYKLDTERDYVAMGATITRGGGECGAANQATSRIRSKKASCGGCQVSITDDDPNAPYPKPLKLALTCNTLCEEETWVCSGGLNMQLTQTCGN